MHPYKCIDNLLRNVFGRALKHENQILDFDTPATAWRIVYVLCITDATIDEKTPSSYLQWPIPTAFECECDSFSFAFLITIYLQWIESDIHSVGV